MPKTASDPVSYPEAKFIAELEGPLLAASPSLIARLISPQGF
jgi:hypothetical protein